jgi:hypothetical protein
VEAEIVEPGDHHGPLEGGSDAAPGRAIPPAEHRPLRLRAGDLGQDLVRRPPADLKTAILRLVELWKEHDPRTYADIFAARANVGTSVHVSGQDDGSLRPPRWR